MDSLSILVHIYGVLLELFTSLRLSYISSALGSPLYMDVITAGRHRVSFVKVCVEISSGFKVPKFIDVQLQDGSLASIRVEIP
ncbi:hypothetical protein V6N13_025749 [Hibiscus sabdariffa]